MPHCIKVWHILVANDQGPRNWGEMHSIGHVLVLIAQEQRSSPLAISELKILELIKPPKHRQDLPGNLGSGSKRIYSFLLFASSLKS